MPLDCPGPHTSGRRSASPGRSGPPPRSNVELPTNEIDTNECKLPVPFDHLSDLHHTSLVNSRKGRLYSYNGVTYYSPNSTQNVSVPEPFPEGKQNILKQPMATLADFQTPWWYNRRYRFLPYVPLVPFFDDLMCSPLRRRLEEEEDFVEEDGFWQVPKVIVEEWMEIEKQTRWLITWLEAYRRPYQRAVRPPSDMGLYRKFRTVGHAAYFVKRTKDWFMVLFSYATWMLSDHHIFSNPDRERSAIWIHLTSHVDVTFLRSFVNSVVVCISSQVPRVGCFFDIAGYDEDTTKTVRQMHRFIYNSVPFWFPLNEETWTILKKPELRKFRPPRELLVAFEQKARTRSIASNPLYKDMGAVDAWRKQVAENPVATTPPTTWEVFFEKRAEVHERLTGLESSKERQRRLDRERYAQKGWSGTATYFKWVVDEDHGVRRRTRIDKDDVRVEMVRHAPTQRRFDSFANEWDLCTDFGSWGDYDVKNRYYEDGDSEVDDDEDDNDEGVEEHEAAVNPGPYVLPRYFITPPAALPVPSGLPPFVENDSPFSPPATPERELGFEHIRHLTGAMAARLPLLFGLCLQGIPSTLPSVGAEHQNVIYRAFGGESQPRPLPDVPVNSLLYTLFTSLFQYQSRATLFPLPAGLFDLVPICPEMQSIIRSTVTMTAGVFFIKPWSNGPCPTIVVYHAEAAIFCCRLENRDFTSMATALFAHGIRFNSCVESSQPLPPPPSDFIFPFVPPVVCKDSKFDKAAYDRFTESRRLFLVGPRRRAALLEGGLISRIARDVIGDEAECERLILQDPSPTVLSSAINVVAGRGDGTFLYDDVLADYEKDYILGIHFHLNDSSGSLTAKSWWPRSSVLEKGDASGRHTSVYHWYWDDHNEHWYQRVAAALCAREEQFPDPKTTAKWRRDSHVIGSVRQFYGGYKGLCQDVLDCALG